MTEPVRADSRLNRRSAGFTLIELMSALAILAILSAVALPSYRNYVKRGKLPEAFNTLSGASMAMEQYYQDNRSYLGGGACAGIAATANFSYSSTCTATGYTLTATGTSGATTGFKFGLDQSGARTTAAVPSGWQLPNPNSCWVSSTSGACQ